MAEVAYTRKYRPVSLDDYLGENLKTIVKSRMRDEKNFPQIVFAYGTRGTGKTTLLRLIAKEYMCLDRKNGRACGKCDMCLDIEEQLIHAEFGASTAGITEVNIGTEGGKADMERLMEEMTRPPMYGYKYNIFILDEVHMMTRGSQNALLKILEEPPSYLVIMMATTEPDKLLGTIRDRCQMRLQMKPATVDDLVARMKYICEKENIRTGPNALKMIAKMCKRNPRDCLMTLENVAKNYDHDVTIKNIMAERGAVETEIYEAYIKAANSKSSAISETLLFLNMLEEKGITHRQFLEGLTDFIMECIALKYKIGIEDATPEKAEAMKELFKRYDTEQMDCLLQILEYANKQIMMNENTGKLTLLNTALRIGKVDVLSIGLQRVERDTVRETNIGMEEAAKIVKEEAITPASRTASVDESILASVFGREIKEVSAGVNIALVDSDETSEEESSLGMSDDEIMSLFGYSENGSGEA